jgi:hypothetical protein
MERELPYSTTQEVTSPLVIVSERLRERMKSDLNTLRAMSRSTLVSYVALIGAVSGFVAWAMMVVAHWVFGIDRPSVTSLLLAIPRGALYGAVIALILHAYWKRHPGKSDSAS